MNTRNAVLLLALTTAISSAVLATPLDEIRANPVSMLEFGSFKLEVALTGIKDWPFPIKGASVPYKIDPDQIEIVVAVRKVRPELFRTACSKTIGRVREFLYVNADGVAPMGRSFLNNYFRGPWRGDAREAALRLIDANTLIRVDVVEGGSCEESLIKAPVTFEATPPKS
ncbi:MAG: hypothetical protein WAO76_05005 [Georgfuchsia sp.]